MKNDRVKIFCAKIWKIYFKIKNFIAMMVGLTAWLITARHRERYLKKFWSKFWFLTFLDYWMSGSNQNLVSNLVFWNVDRTFGCRTSRKFIWNWSIRQTNQHGNLIDHKLNILPKKTHRKSQHIKIFDSKSKAFQWWIMIKFKLNYFTEWKIVNFSTKNFFHKF